MQGGRCGSIHARILARHHPMLLLLLSTFLTGATHAIDGRSGLGHGTDVMSTKTRGKVRVSEGVGKPGLAVPCLGPYPPFPVLSNIRHSTQYLLPPATSVSLFSSLALSLLLYLATLGRHSPFLCSARDCSVRLNVTCHGLL